MNLRRFFVFSAVIHTLLLCVLVLLPAPSGKGTGSGEGLSARLVSPDEIGRLPVRRPPGRLKRIPAPLVPSLPAPSLPPAPPQLPPARASAPPPQVSPSPARSAPPVAQPSRETTEKTPRSAQPGYEVKSAQNEKGRATQPQVPASAPQPKVDDEKRIKEGQTAPPAQNKAKGPSENPPKIPQRAPSLRDKLFDKGVIGDLARRDIERKERENKDSIPLRDANREHAYNFGAPLRERGEKKFSTDKQLALDEKELKFMLYNMKLKDRLEHIWIYPPSAAARGISGDLIIRFTIMKNGQLGRVELVRTSGHKDLDDAAVRALRDGNPYWPLPESWGMDSYTIEGHFIYTIIYNL